MTDEKIKRTSKKVNHVPEPRNLRMPPSDYQPSKADMEVESDMPTMSDDELRRAFFRPFRFVRDGSE